MAQRGYALDLQVTVPADASPEMQAEIFRHASAQIAAMIAERGATAMAHPRKPLPPEEPNP
jgi:hypothetical protein